MRIGLEHCLQFGSHLVFSHQVPCAVQAVLNLLFKTQASSEGKQRQGKARLSCALAAHVKSYTYDATLQQLQHTQGTGLEDMAQKQMHISEPDQHLQSANAAWLYSSKICFVLLIISCKSSVFPCVDLTQFFNSVFKKKKTKTLSTGEETVILPFEEAGREGVGEASSVLNEKRQINSFLLKPGVATSASYSAGQGEQQVCWGSGLSCLLGRYWGRDHLTEKEHGKPC